MPRVVNETVAAELYEIASVRISEVTGVDLGDLLNLPHAIRKRLLDEAQAIISQQPFPREYRDSMRRVRERALRLEDRPPRARTSTNQFVKRPAALRKGVVAAHR